MDFSSPLSLQHPLSCQEKSWKTILLHAECDEAEEHDYRPSGVIIIIFWSTEYK